MSATTVVAFFEVGFNSYGLFASSVCKQVGPDSYDYHSFTTPYIRSAVEATE